MENGSTNSGPPIRGGGFRGRGGKFIENKKMKKLTRYKSDDLIQILSTQECRVVVLMDGEG